MATQEQVELFKRDGYVVLSGFLTPAECEDVVTKIRSAQHEVSNSRLDKSGLTFKHNLYRTSDALRQFLAQPKIVHFLRDIIGPDFWIRWDQAVEKTPGGSEFPWHQDNGYNGLDEGHFQLWVALSEMTPDNGGLWLQKGSHRQGRLPHKRIGNHLVASGNHENAVFIDAKVGDCVLFSSFMLHRTSPNITTTSRLAYVAEYMSCKHFDPFIPAPYFMIAKGGEPKPEWANFYPGRLSPGQQLKYLPERVSRQVKAVRSRVGRLIKGKPKATVANT